MLNFLIAFAVSFLGSIPLGSLNLTVLQIYLNHHFRSVVYFSFAAGLVEFFYSYVAVRGEVFLLENPNLNQVFSYITIVIFFFLGFINLLSKPKPVSSRTLDALNVIFEPNDFRFFRKGLILSILNPQAIPFWLVLSNFLGKRGLVQFNSIADTFYYTLGVAFGTSVCLIVFVFVAGTMVKQKQIRAEKLNRFIGLIFLSMGIFQLGKMIY